MTASLLTADVFIFRVIVIMLFRLCMSIEDSIKAYTVLAKRVFSKKKWLHQQGTSKTTLLEAVILRIIESAFKNIKGDAAKEVRMLNEEGHKTVQILLYANLQLQFCLCHFCTTH